MKSIRQHPATALSTPQRTVGKYPMMWACAPTPCWISKTSSAQVPRATSVATREYAGQKDLGRAAFVRSDSAIQSHAESL